MTNEDLSKQVQNLADIVATLAETMNAKFDQIDTQLSNIRKDHKNLTDIVKDMELRIDKRFAEVDEQFAKVNERFVKVDERFVKVDEHFAKLETGQASLCADIAGLRHDIFVEEGSREEVDDTVLFGARIGGVRLIYSVVYASPYGMDGMPMVGVVRPHRCEYYSIEVGTSTSAGGSANT